MKSNLLPVAKEGSKYILGSVLAFIVFAFFDLGFLQFLAFLITLFFIFVFRNPERENIFFDKDSVLSPVDGIVTAVEELKDSQYLYKVDIDSSYLNVSLLRVPFSSSLSQIKIHKGARLSKFSPLSKTINENAELIFSDDNSHNVKVVHVLSKSIKSIDIEAINSQSFHQGIRYGLMLNGTTSIYLPKNFRLNVNVGSELIASEGLIGYFTN